MRGCRQASNHTDSLIPILDCPHNLKFFAQRAANPCEHLLMIISQHGRKLHVLKI